MTANCLAQTEARLTVTDRVWRAEMNRFYGPDGVLHHGFGPTAGGPVGTRLREAYDARHLAIAAWRQERRPRV